MNEHKFEETLSNQFFRPSMTVPVEPMSTVQLSWVGGLQNIKLEQLKHQKWSEDLF